MFGSGSLDVIVRFISDSSQVTSEVAKIQGSVGAMGTAMKGVGAAIATGFAVQQVSEFVKEASEAEKISKTLAQTMRNAGDSTGQWTKEAEKLANTLMKKTGIDDEQIKQGQAILATFHEITGAAGQQNNMMERATKASLDLSVTGFGSVDSAAKQLGKALQDPVKGMGALSRAGVQFTEAQREMIKSLVETGQTAKAQELIMKEVENQVGGVAEASATSADKLKVQWGEAKEAMGKALIPFLTAAVPLMIALSEVVQATAPVLVPLVAVFALLAVTLKIAAVAGALFGVSMTAALWPVLAVVAAVIALIAIGYLLIHNWDAIKKAAADAFNFVLDVVKMVFNWIKNNWPLLLAILSGPIGIATLLIVKNWNTIKNALGDAIDFMVDLWNDFVAFIMEVPRRVWDALKMVGGFIFDAFKSGVDGVYGLLMDVVSWFYGLPGRIVGALGDLAGRLYNIGRDAMLSFLHGLESMMGHIADVVGSFTKKMLKKLNPFGSPHTVAYYQGQAVMRDYLAGARSMRGATIAGFASLGGMTSSGMTTSGGPLTSGGVTYNINVSVEAGVAPAEVGAAVVDRIRAYERVAGRGWRQ